jgi:hypothetical protein
MKYEYAVWRTSHMMVLIKDFSIHVLRYVIKSTSDAGPAEGEGLGMRFFSACIFII